MLLLTILQFLVKIENYKIMQKYLLNYIGNIKLKVAYIKAVN